MAGVFRTTYDPVDLRGPALVDGQGSLPELYIRGTRVCLGDGASAAGLTAVSLLGTASGAEAVAIGNGSSATAANAVSIGDGVTNAVASTVNIGSAGTALIRASSGSSVSGGAAYNHAVGLLTLDTAPTLNSALPFGPGTILSGVPTANRAYTLDTGANYDLQFPNMAVGDSFVFVIANNAAGALTITLTAAAGSTITGTATVAQNIARYFMLQKTAAATWVATNLFSHACAA